MSVTTADQEAIEGGSLTLEMIREGGDQSKALTIPLILSGTGQPEDYTLSSENVVFAPGASTASVTLDITNVSDAENPETVIVELGALPSEILRGTPNSVTITISRSDFETTVNMLTSSREMAEGESVALEFSRSGVDLSQSLTIPLFLGGTSQVSDYTLSSENVVFAPGDSTVSVT